MSTQEWFWLIGALFVVASLAIHAIYEPWEQELLILTWPMAIWFLGMALTDALGAHTLSDPTYKLVCENHVSVTICNYKEVQ